MCRREISSSLERFVPFEGSVFVCVSTDDLRDRVWFELTSGWAEALSRRVVEIEVCHLNI